MNQAVIRCLVDNYNYCSVKSNQNHFETSIKIPLKYFSWTVVVTSAIYKCMEKHGTMYGTSNTPQRLIIKQQDGKYLLLKMHTMCTLSPNVLKYYICLTQSRKSDCRVSPPPPPPERTSDHSSIYVIIPGKGLRIIRRLVLKSIIRRDAAVAGRLKGSF